jgi:AraC-like DNA-binding protein
MDELIHEALRHLSSAAPPVEPVGGLQLVQQHATSPAEPALYEPVLCLILQGRKEVSIGDRTLTVGPGECLLVSHDLPVRSAVRRAPYLALLFQVDIAAVRRLHDEVAESPVDGARASAAETHRASPGLVDALRRYLALADSPADAKVLGPLSSREIHYRLLTAPFGGMLRRLGRRDTSASAIARAISHIRSDIRAPLAIPKLARRVGMSASSFHQHFKKATSTTPLQYQKELRLLEARRLLRAGGTSVTSAAFEVGYESLSQFSREYARTFGVPPSEDLGKPSGAQPARPPRSSRAVPRAVAASVRRAPLSRARRPAAAGRSCRRRSRRGRR